MAYLGWFGPRGLASIVFAVLVVEASVPHAGTIVDATVLTVIAAVILHGLSAAPLTARYARRLGRQRTRTGIEAAETRVRVPVARAQWARGARR